ncbi:MAG: hypothetical protein HYV63_08070 [Candidatus Schekmanbacteria bacterium]|nr:hypothetical protein [Candidatus Schekmanbacteria bacterium]
MIAPPNSSSATMTSALAHTMHALEAARGMDKDLSAEQRDAMGTDHDALAAHLEKVAQAEGALERFRLVEGARLQARVTVGDDALDRGVRAAKARMRLELRRTALPAGADRVFGDDLEGLVDADLRLEPTRVLEAVARFADVPDFPGKAEMLTDLRDRAERQQAALVERDAGDVTEAGLKSTLVHAVADASLVLYQLEKRLLERFPRQRSYVGLFFLRAGRGGKRPASPEPAAKAPAVP